MLPSFMTKPFVRKRFPLVEDHGSQVRDYSANEYTDNYSDSETYSAPDEATFYGSVQPGTGTEELINRNGADIVKTIWAQPGSDVRHDDLITLSDGDYQVNGSPEVWETGVMDHVVIRLSRWEG